MTAQFKVGSVYRDRAGDLVRVERRVPHIVSDRLREYYGDDALEVSRWHDEEWVQYGWRRATDGTHNHDGDRYTILPGELHNVNGQWVPVAEEAPKPATTLGALLRQALERPPIPQPKYLGIDWAKGCAPAAEKVRPPLTWTTPAKFDPWKGFFTEPADIAEWQDTYFPR